VIQQLGPEAVRTADRLAGASPSPRSPAGATCSSAARCARSAPARQPLDRHVPAVHLAQPGHRRRFPAPCLARYERERGLLLNLIADDFYERTSVVAPAKRFNAGLR